MTPMRANIVGPLSSATSIRLSIAAFLKVGGLHIAAEIPAINLSRLAFTADNAALHFLSQGFAQLVQQHECGLVPRSRLRASALLPSRQSCLLAPIPRGLEFVVAVRSVTGL
jgi:hypothetical protein